MNKRLVFKISTNISLWLLFYLLLWSANLNKHYPYNTVRYDDQNWFKYKLDLIQNDVDINNSYDLIVKVRLQKLTNNIQFRFERIDTQLDFLEAPNMKQAISFDYVNYTDNTYHRIELPESSTFLLNFTGIRSPYSRLKIDIHYTALKVHTNAVKYYFSPPHYNLFIYTFILLLSIFHLNNSRKLYYTIYRKREISVSNIEKFFIRKIHRNRNQRAAIDEENLIYNKKKTKKKSKFLHLHKVIKSKLTKYWVIFNEKIIQKFQRKIYVKEINQKVSACCYQTARLQETYCLCGKAVSTDLQTIFEN